MQAWHGAAAAGGLVLHAAVIARAITRSNRTPASRVAWVAVILLLPVLGPLGYLLLGELSIGVRRAQRLRQAEQATALTHSPHAPMQGPYAPLFALAASVNMHAPTTGNHVALMGAQPATPEAPTRDCDAALEALIADVGSARESVHLSFYIWLEDGNGGRMADAVCAAARRGVRSRVMVDALGSRAFTHSPRWPQLQAAGVECVAALDDLPRLGASAIGRVDLRNHRKLAVIDSRIAWCGSQNCADPAFRVAAAYAPWIDLLLRCEGPVVRHAQRLFIETWMAETGTLLAIPNDVASTTPANEGGATALMFGTGPLTPGNAMSDVFVAAVMAARHELLITTPYFVPDEALLRALCAAPRRGVATTLVFPARNNSKLVDLACRSTWDELLRSGVDVRLYRPGLLHSKSLTIDGALALVGSANMDRRSLQLNFENNLLLCNSRAVADIRARQLGYISECEAVALESVQRWGFGRRLLQDAVGMLGPVL